MKLLSIQKVEKYQFTLYFLAFTDEEPPNSDLESEENREWLWQRKFSILELQKKWSQVQYEEIETDQPGFAGITFKINDLNKCVNLLLENGIQSSQDFPIWIDDLYDNLMQKCVVIDPNNIPIYL